MVDRRFRRRRSLRGILLFATGFCSLFLCFSWYSLMCCRTNMYGGYIINNYPIYSLSENSMDSHIQNRNSESSKHEPAMTETSGSYNNVGHDGSYKPSDISHKTTQTSMNKDELGSVINSFDSRPTELKHIQVENTNRIEDLSEEAINSNNVLVKSDLGHRTEVTDEYNSRVSQSQSQTFPSPVSKKGDPMIHGQTFHPNLKHSSGIQTLEVPYTITALNSNQNPSSSNLDGPSSPIVNNLQSIPLPVELQKQDIVDDTLHQQQIVHYSERYHQTTPIISPDYNDRSHQTLPIISPPIDHLPTTPKQDILPFGDKLYPISDHSPRTMTLRSLPTNRPSIELTGQDIHTLTISDSLQKTTDYLDHPHQTIAVRSLPTSHPNSIPSTFELDQYAVRAWLPRGIKERTESTSQESSSSNVLTYNSEKTTRTGHQVLTTGKDTKLGQHGLVSASEGKTDGQFLSRDVRDSSSGPEVGTRVGQSRQKRRDVVVSDPVKRLPQALIIGVKKCGTRALLEFLRVHPDVRASGPETHFFDRHYQRGLEWYRQQMPSSLEGQITMEKTPSYFITRDAPPRIRAMSSSTRLLVVVRDPVTRALSDYTQAASKRPSSASFEEMAFRNASTGLVDTSWPAIRLGVYARFLEWWTPHHFPKEQVLFISGEELVRDPAAEMGRVQDFLGLKRIVSEKHFYFNETKGFPCLKKSEGSGNPHCLGKTKGRAHPEISSATIQRLRDFYRPFNVKFYQMVGRNFGWP